MTLYLKYRPQTLSDLDLVGARESLIKIVKSGNISHALLFSGPRGTGKTSAARILAKTINCEAVQKERNEIEPCNKCEQCMSITKGINIDVIELDAASHRGIDDIRVLRDAVKLAPIKAKKKIYIIDEAHMLTVEASNALLKTLEEPPEHVIFILATTNPEKLIDTIRSRVTNIKFTKATNKEIVARLEKVAWGEGLKVTTDTLDLLAQVSEGSFRDAVKILEQVVSEKVELNAEKVNEYLFRRETFNVTNFMKILVARDTKTALSVIEEALTKGITPLIMTKNLIQTLRKYLMTNLGFEGEKLEGLNKEDLVALINLFSESVRQIPGSVLEQIPLEIAVITWCEAGKKKDFDAKGEKKDRGEVAVQKEPEKAPKLEKSEIKKSINLHNTTDGISQEVWVRVLSEVRPKNASTEALLRAARPVSFDGQILTLGVYYSFHKERLEDNPHRDLLEKTIEEIMGNKIRVVCTLTDPPEKPKVQEQEVVLTENGDEDIVKVAKELFGS